MKYRSVSILLLCVPLAAGSPLYLGQFAAPGRSLNSARSAGGALTSRRLFDKIILKQRPENQEISTLPETIPDTLDQAGRKGIESEVKESKKGIKVSNAQRDAENSNLESSTSNKDNDLRMRMLTKDSIGSSGSRNLDHRDKREEPFDHHAPPGFIEKLLTHNLNRTERRNEIPRSRRQKLPLDDVLNSPDSFNDADPINEEKSGSESVEKRLPGSPARSGLPGDKEVRLEDTGRVHNARTKRFATEDCPDEDDADDLLGLYTVYINVLLEAYISYDVDRMVELLNCIQEVFQDKIYDAIDNQELSYDDIDDLLAGGILTIG